MSDVPLPTGGPYGQRKELEEQGFGRAGPRELSPEAGVTDPQPHAGLSSPTEFPQENLFEGARGGPGGGPEVQADINSLPDPDDQAMEHWVPILEGIVENRRWSSQAARQLVRRARSQLPIEE